MAASKEAKKYPISPILFIRSHKVRRRTPGAKAMKSNKSKDQIIDSKRKL